MQREAEQQENAQGTALLTLQKQEGMEGKLIQV